MSAKLRIYFILVYWRFKIERGANMIKLSQYPQIDCSENLRKQIIALQCTAWPPAPGDEDKPWPGSPEIHISSFVLMDNNIVVSHVAIMGKDITHKGQIYKAFGLAEVVTHPSYQKRGFGLQLINKAAAFIENNKPDISLFTCKPSLINFYAQGGWEYMKNTCLVGGTRDNPFRSDSLGLATMMRFYSDKAKEHRQDFENSNVYLELGEKQLW